MRFLLIAPEHRDPCGDDARSEVGLGRHQTARASSSGLVYEHLEQDFTSPFIERAALDCADVGLQQLAGTDVHVERVRRYESVCGVVWSVLIDIEMGPELLGPSTGALERQLSALAERVLTELGCDSLLWVSRTLVHQETPGSSESAAFHSWLERTDDSGHPAGPSFVVDDGAFTVGWGNNLLFGKDPDALLELVEASLVLAQFLWAHVYELSEAAAAALLTGIAIAQRSSRAAQRSFTADVERLTEELGIQHMLTDEFTHNNQGASISTRILEVWGFGPFQESMRRRIEDLRGMAQDLRARQQSRYQRTVERVLIIIGMVALLDVAVGAIQLAFAGGVTEVPGSGEAVSVLRSVRTFGADGALLLALGSVGVLVLGILVAMGRLRSDRG